MAIATSSDTANLPPRSSTPPLADHGEYPRPSRCPSSSSPTPDSPALTCAPAAVGHQESFLLRGLPQRHASSHSRRPVIAQPTPPSSRSPLYDPAPGGPPSASEDHLSGKRPSAWLPDLSQYKNSLQTQEDEGTTLEELAHLVRLSKYQERKRANTRVRLQRNLVSTALSARLTRCGETARRNLVDCFRTDDKKTFAPLFNAIHDVRKSCDELRRYALLEPELDSLQPPPAMASPDGLDAPPSSPTFGSALGTTVSFLNEVPASAREIFLNFLTQIRTNPDYLAARLCSLSASDLNALTTFHHGLEPIESVLPYHGRSNARHQAATSSRPSAHQSTAIERLLSFQRHDPLSALIHTCFANSAGPDSVEDRRRTDTWATALAKLITEHKSNSEHIMTTVLNIWTAMRDWAGRTNMEWFLMKILEDGAFLLDRAEDQHGTRFNLSDWSPKDSIAAEEFYERAVHELFEIVDDEDATGIPEGLLELGQAVLRKLDSKLVDTTTSWFLYKWLFSSFLLSVIIHPEGHGMMAEYHITEYGRQKILKQVAMRAQQLVVDTTWNNKSAVSVPPKIRGHVESIMSRFKGGVRTQRQVAKLLPARSITSLRETVEVHPYLVVSPSDLLTLVNALFPERRPSSAQSGSLRSAAPSISGISSTSQPLSMTPLRNSNVETASVLSTSASSISDTTTPGDAAMEEQRTGSPRRYSPPAFDTMAQHRLSNFEDDGYRLRFALHEMTTALGTDAVQGSCHPCAERWTVLFISSDGSSLSTEMTLDPEDDVEEADNSSTDSDDDNSENGPELDKDYHQLRDSILKLVEDFEIPQSVEPESYRTQFSNRATGIKKYRSKNKVITAEKSRTSRNPYRKEDVPRDSRSSQTSPHAVGASEQHRDELKDPPPVLITMLSAASSQSRAQSDFVSAHMYWQTLQQLNALTSSSLRSNGFAVLLNIFSRGPRDSIRLSASSIEEYDAWLVWLKQSQERHEGLIDGMMKRLRALRDKMWYVTDVRNSAPYEQSRNICAALKTMGMPRRWGAFQRNRAHMARGPAANYLYRTETQIMDLLSASEEQGGPNKLSDDQAEKTSRWLHQTDVANFCRGEERIHRFCCEVDACISKLVGESIVDTPVLWSSELFKRDRKSLEGKKAARDRDSLWCYGADDTASVVSDHERRYPASSRAPVIRDLRSMSAHNSSQQSFDSGSYRFSRASTALSDIMDGPDYFGVSSPVHTIDSSSTFWSPFQSAISPSSTASRAHSPTTSVTNLSTSFSLHHQHYPSFSSQSTGRPATSASSNETVYQQRLNEEKTRFLHDLRQTLTSLLLSDLGNLVFSKGSETDQWFEAWGQECIERRDGLERPSKKPSTGKDQISNNAVKIRVIEKKKSFGNLRNAGEVDRSSETTESPSTPGHDSSATSDTISAGSKSVPNDSSPEFPFKKAFQRLFRMFSVHPSPYGKLNALYELEQLIIASLATSGSRRRLGWARVAPNALRDDHDETSRADPLGDAIDNVKERRSHALLQSPVLSPMTIGSHQSRSGSTESRSVAAAGSGGTDAVVNVLHNLLRDATIRPKTLFRDLQFVAAFVNPLLLDKTDKGKSFWDTGLAALSLKSEVCRTMLKLANDIQKRTIDGNLRESQSSRSESPVPITTGYSLADAGRMWTVLAKEGDSAAQRELALFYLMDPELVERTILPLSKPSEVFKQTVMDKYDRGSAQTKSGARGYSGERGRLNTGVGSSGGGAGSFQASSQEGAGEGGIVWNDPALMCIAIHFFQAAEQGGDELASSFMRQNDLV